MISTANAWQRRAQAVATGVLANPETGGEHWFHGTTQAFDRFRDPGKRVGGSWNTRLGVHFTSHEETAANFAYDWNKPERPGQVLHARLQVHNPLRVTNEREIEEHASRVVLGKELGDRYLGDRRDAGRVARQYVKHLKAQGHDGIVYPNHLESDGKPSVIVFHPDQVEVTHRRTLKPPL